MRPVCVKCQIEYRPKENGVTVEELAGEESYKLWQADLWECPGCGHLLISGYGQKPIAEQWMDKYPTLLAATEGRRYVVKERPDLVDEEEPEL